MATRRPSGAKAQRAGAKTSLTTQTATSRVASEPTPTGSTTDPRFAAALTEARAAASDGARVLPLLIDAWSVYPDARIADAIDALGAQLESPDARALRALESPDDARWSALERRGALADRGALLATLHRTTGAVVYERMERAHRWPIDPRFARTLSRWFEELPFRATATKPAWTLLFDRVQRSADFRVLEALDAARLRGFAVGKSMGDWLREKTDRAHTAVRASVAALPPLDEAHIALRDAVLDAVRANGADSESASPDHSLPKSSSSPSPSSRRATHAWPTRALEDHEPPVLTPRARVIAANADGLESLDHAPAKGLWLLARAAWSDRDQVEGALRDAALHVLEGLWPLPASEAQADRVDDPGSSGGREALASCSEVALYDRVPDGQTAPRWVRYWPGPVAIARDGSWAFFAANKTLAFASTDDGALADRVCITDEGFSLEDPGGFTAGSADDTNDDDVRSGAGGPRHTIGAVAAGPQGLCAFTYRRAVFLYRRGARRARAITRAPSYGPAVLAFDDAGRTLITADAQSWRSFALGDDPCGDDGVTLAQATHGLSTNWNGLAVAGLTADGATVLHALPYSDPTYTESDARTGLTKSYASAPGLSHHALPRHALPNAVHVLATSAGRVEPHAALFTKTVAPARGPFVLRSLRDGGVFAPLDAGPSSVDDVCVAPDGGLFVAAHADGALRAYATGREGDVRFELTDTAGLGGARFAPDGAWMLSRARVSLQCWGISSEKKATRARLLYKLRAHAYRIHAVAISHDGARFATASEDALAAVFTHASQGKQRVELRGHRGAVRDVAFHPLDAALVATAGRDGTVRVWDATKGTALATLETDATGGAMPPVTALAFSADGSLLFAGTRDGALYAFDLQKQRQSSRVPLGAAVTALAVCPRTGAVYVATRDGALSRATRDEANPRLIERFLVAPRALALDADGRTLVAGAGHRTLGGCATVLRATE